MICAVSRAVAIALCGFLFVPGALAEAQATRQPARRTRTMAGSVDPTSVRAEYASLLLQASRYREAAAEYRQLLLRNPESFEWRLNYARALAWGGAHRQAELELKRLQRRAPANATVESLLRSVRASIQPTSREARAWVTERPRFPPYQLALARAYVRERRPRRAFPHFDLVLAQQPSAALFSEAGDAHTAGGDLRGAADLYRRAVERSPSDVALRRSYARTLAASRQYAASIEQFSLLIEERPDPRLLTERGDARRRSGDEEGAERDLLASIALFPTVEAYTALGDMYRWRGQYRRARSTYDEALELRPNDRRVTWRMAQLIREQRPGFGYASTVDEQPGFTFGGRTIVDNSGFAYVAGELRRGFELAPGTVVGLGVEPRFVYDASPGALLPGELRSAQQIVGAAGTVGLAQSYHGEGIDVRIAGRGGAAAHSSGAMIPLLAGSAVLTYRGAWSLSVEGTGGPAYANVMAPAVVDEASTFDGTTDALLTSQTFAIAATAPFGVADVAAEFESLWLSDGNRRAAFQASARLPVAQGFSLLYSGGSLAFAERSTLYWDPFEYLFHSLGLEFGARTDDGFAFTARVLPGFARTVEGLTTGSPSFDDAEPGAAQFVGHVAAMADVSVRRKRWETALSAAYGTGRSGGYQRFDGGLRVRYIP